MSIQFGEIIGSFYVFYRYLLGTFAKFFTGQRPSKLGIKLGKLGILASMVTGPLHCNNSAVGTTEKAGCS